MDTEILSKKKVDKSVLLSSVPFLDLNKPQSNLLMVHLLIWGLHTDHLVNVQESDFLFLTAEESHHELLLYHKPSGKSDENKLSFPLIKSKFLVT